MNIWKVKKVSEVTGQSQPGSGDFQYNSEVRGMTGNVALGRLPPIGEI